jgi:hypothetical protein
MIDGCDCARKDFFFFAESGSNWPLGYDNDTRRRVAWQQLRRRAAAPGCGRWCSPPLITDHTVRKTQLYFPEIKELIAQGHSLSSANASFRGV